MGYVYEGRKLCCDACGEPGARKRACVFKVTNEGGGVLPYCPAPALCGACFKQRGGGKGVHAGCEEGARAAQARADAKKARLAAGEHVHCVSYGDWHAAVPEGWVGLGFRNQAGEELRRLAPKAAYERLREMGAEGSLEALERELGQRLAPWNEDAPLTKRVGAEG